MMQIFQKKNLDEKETNDPKAQAMFKRYTHSNIIIFTTSQQN